MLDKEQAQKIREVVEQALYNQHAASNEIVLLLQNLLDITESDRRHIVRGFTLPANYRMAGLMLIHQFSAIVRQEHPNIQAKFTMQEENGRIKLQIEAEEAEIATIEKMLEHYSAILLGKSPLNSISGSEQVIMELKQRLDMTALELTIHQNMQEFDLEKFGGNLHSLEREVTQMHALVGQGMAGLSHVQSVIHSLLAEERQEISHALLLLQSKLARGTLEESDEKEVKEALLTLKTHEPDAFEEIQETLNRSSSSGSAGDLLFSWLASISSAMPK